MPVTVRHNKVSAVADSGDASLVQPSDWNAVHTVTGLATVAETGAYADLTGRPSLATVATTGAYADLTGAPTLAPVATTGAYSDLTGRPSLAAVATSGAYADLTGTPSLATVATSGSAADLTGNLAVARFNGGTGASGSTFWRGDGTWATVSATPAGSTTQLQYNNAGAFAGASGITTNGTALTITPAANETGLTLTGGSLTGSNASAFLSVAGTWNTTGTPTALDVNVTDTASNAASLLMNLRVGGASAASVSKSRILTTGSVLADASTGGFTATAAGSFAPSFTAGRVFIDGANNGVVSINSTGHYGLSSGNASGTGNDVRLYRDAANTLAQRNGTNAQTFRLYNTFTDASNYERGVVGWVSNEFRLGMERAGTGAWRGVRVFSPSYINLEVAGVDRIGISSTIINANLPIEFAEQAAPAAPAADRVRLYAEDNGAGKTRLMARFATGAAVQIAIEP